MTFRFYPAIDLLDGNCVRLYKGDYDQKTIYESNPFIQASKFANEGAKFLHVVDLNGSRNGVRQHTKQIKEIVENTSLKLQVGGGIRTEKDIELYLSLGVERVVLGSVIIKDPEFTLKMLEKYKEKIVLGLDAINGKIAIEGWEKTTQDNLEDIALQWKQAGATTVIYTDISKDGTLKGPNLEGCLKLAQSSGLEIIVSGGVSTIDDISSAVTYKNVGISGIIAGKAIYENRFTVEEAMKIEGVLC